MTNPDWREEMKAYTTSKYHLELLENGAKSLSQSWILSYLYQKWQKIKGHSSVPPGPAQQSSFKEWSNKIKEEEQ